MMDLVARDGRDPACCGRKAVDDFNKTASGQLRTADHAARFHVYRWMQEEMHREHLGVRRDCLTRVAAVPLGRSEGHSRDGSVGPARPGGLGERGDGETRQEP